MSHNRRGEQWAGRTGGGGAGRRRPGNGRPQPTAGGNHGQARIDTAVREFGRVDVLVSNAAQQRTHDKLEDIPDEEWDRTLAVNLSAFFYLTKAGIANMTAALAQLLAPRGIRAKSVAPHRTRES